MYIQPEVWAVYLRIPGTSTSAERYKSVNVVAQSVGVALAAVMALYPTCQVETTTRLCCVDLVAEILNPGQYPEEHT